MPLVIEQLRCEPYLAFRSIQGADFRHFELRLRMTSTDRHISLIRPQFGLQTGHDYQLLESAKNSQILSN